MSHSSQLTPRWLVRLLPHVAIVLLLSGCLIDEPLHIEEIELVERSAVPLIEEQSVTVQNCLFPWSRTERVVVGGRLSAKNIPGNGGEPFRSIGNKLFMKYGSFQRIPLSAPPRSRATYHLALQVTEYEGIVLGDIIDESKVQEEAEVPFTYAHVEKVVITGQVKEACE